MSKPKAPNSTRGNLSELKQAIRDGVANIKQAKSDRTENNADISAIIESLEAKGIHRRALKIAMQYAEWDADTRAGFDVAYAVTREALGVPFEDGLFDADGQPNADLLKPKTKGKDAAAEPAAAAGPLVN